MSEVPPDMSPQEAELLKYLEDLQQNNPAEYEMLVKDLQEKEAEKRGGKLPPSQQQAEQVTPTPGFVAKTRSATRQGAKVFVNVCSSDHVDAPAPVENAQGSAQTSDEGEYQMRIPLSLGPPREDLDKNGEVCTVYDVVFHPDAVEGALKEAEFRGFVMNLVVHQVQQKYKDELSTDFSYPKVKGNYKGIAPLPQYMRKKGMPPPPLPGSEEEKKAAEAAAAAESGNAKGGGSKLVEELDANNTGNESLPAPSYAVEPRRINANAIDPDGLSIKAHLPHVSKSSSSTATAAAPDDHSLTHITVLPSLSRTQVDDFSEIQLSMSSESVELLVPNICSLSLQVCAAAAAAAKQSIRAHRASKPPTHSLTIHPPTPLAAVAGGGAFAARQRDV